MRARPAAPRRPTSLRSRAAPVGTEAALRGFVAAELRVHNVVGSNSAVAERPLRPVSDDSAPPARLDRAKARAAPYTTPPQTAA